MGADWLRQHPLCQKDRASEKANSRLSTEASQPADSKEAVQIEKVHDRMQAQVMPLMQPFTCGRACHSPS